MKQLFKSFVCGAVILATAACSEVDNSRGEPLALTRAQEEMMPALTEFSWNLLKEAHYFTPDEYFFEENTLISPFSAAATIGMIANACEGETKAKLTELLGFNSNDLASFDELVLNAMNQFPKLDKKVKFSSANSLWLLQPSMIPSEGYKSVMDVFYNAPIDQITSGPGGEYKIAEWAKKSMGRDFDNSDFSYNITSNLLWINLLDFEGDWAIGFDKSKTHDEFFTTYSGVKKKVKMMEKKGKFKNFCRVAGKPGDDGFSWDKEFAGVTLEYGNGSFGFTAIIPMGGRDLKWLFENLTSADIQGFLKRRDERYKDEIKLYLPKFEANCDTKLTPCINKMLGSDLLEQLELPKLKALEGYANIKQNASIKVYESGTKFTVKTKVEHGLTSVGPDFLAFDEPFIYFIHDLDNCIILAAGVFGR